MQRAMQETVDEVGRVVAAEGIDCDCAKGGTVGAGPDAGRSSSGPAAEVAEARRCGFGDDDLALLDAAEARAPAAPRPGCSAATYTPHCAAVHPARLVRGLAARGRAARGDRRTSGRR